MLTRRTFVQASTTSAVAATIATPGEQSARRRRLAVITTEWRERSHAWHMAERFLHGYPMYGRWHRPPFDFVSAYVDQFPKSDLSRDRAKEFGLTIYKTIADALRCGGDRLDVDAVLLIGEHGRYPINKLGQTEYPRYEFFRQVVEVFARMVASCPCSTTSICRGAGMGAPKWWTRARR